MNKNLTDSFREIFRPQLPNWACEFTRRHVIVAGVDKRRTRVTHKASHPLPSGLLTPSLGAANIESIEELRTILRETLRTAAFKGSEIGVVISDEAARIAFVTVEKVPRTSEELSIFLRWKLKKTVPFDIDTAQLAYQILGPSLERSTPAKDAGSDVLVALSPRKIVEEYEHLMESLDIHAGFVIPSTLAALNLIDIPSEDALFVKLAPDCVTTTIFQKKRLKFYRRVPDLGVYESVYPTVLYYQDKLGGTAIQRMVTCAYDVASESLAGLQGKLGIPAQGLEPRSIDDLFKPALGAVHFTWANSI